MKPSPLIRRKLAPARLPDAHLPRPALLAQLARGLEPDLRLTLVCAGPGHGKSTLIAEHLRQSDWPSAWVGWESGDADPLTFFQYLAGALEGVAAGVGERALGLLRAAPDPTEVVATAAGLLAEALGEALPDGGILVLDDVHEVLHQPAIARATEALVAYWPESWQLILASRERPNLPLGQWRVRQQLVELGPKELRFSAHELRALLERLAGVALSDAEALAWLGKTEGWVAPAVLAAQAVRRAGAEAHALLMAELEQPTALYEYLAQELFEQQDAPSQGFLLATCLPETVDAEACRQALGIDDADERIRSLIQGNLLSPLEGTGPLAARYHPSFRAFLLDRLQGARSAEAVAQLRLAWAAARAGSAPDEALALALDAQAHDLAAHHLAQLAEARLAEGRSGSLADVVARFPLEARQRLWAPAFYGGETARLQGAFGAAEADFLAAEGAATTPAQLARAKRHRAAVALARGQASLAESCLAEALALEGGPAADAAERAFAANLEGTLALAQDDAPKAQAAYEQALGLHRSLHDHAGAAKLLNNLGLLHTRHGRFPEALSTLREAVAMAEAAGRLPHPMTLNNLAAVHTYQGEHEAALEAAGRALELAGLLGARRDAAYAWLGLGFARRAAHDHRRAQEAFEHAHGEALALGDLGTAAKAIAAQAEWHAAEGHLGRAQALLDEAARVAGAPPTDPGQGDLLMLAASAAAWGLPLPHGAQALSAYVADVTAKGYRFRECQARYLLAQLHRVAGHPEAALSEHQSAQALAEAQGYLALAAREGQRRPPLPGPAAPPQAAATVPALHLGDRPEAPAELSVRSFGAFEVARGAAPIPSKAWRGHKPKLILAHLLATPRGATKEALTELLYGDVDLDRTAILVLVSRLRHALEPGLGARTASRYVQLVDGRYLLNPAATIQHDLADLAYWAKLADESHQPEKARRQAWEKALNLAARGPYLADLDSASPWVSTEREAHRRRVEVLHEKLRRSHLAEGNWSGALASAESHLAFDPCAEAAHQAKLCCLDRLGRREEALRHASLMASVYRRELGAPPSERLRALAECLRANQPLPWPEAEALGLEAAQAP